jgi:hypothetical protein
MTLQEHLSRISRSATVRACLSATVFLWMVTASLGGALAQEPDDRTARAEALFEEAKRLVAEKRHAEACPKLAESQRLDPGGGTQLHLGLCHEAEGKLATALSDLELALKMAREQDRADRAAIASEHLTALRPRVPRLTLLVDATAPDGLAIEMNGVAFARAEWGTAAPLDPGTYVVRASAPGRETWTRAVELREATAAIVTVPALVMLAGAPPAAGSGAPTSSTPSLIVSPPHVPARGIGPQRIIAIVAAGLGLAAAGTGTAFGLDSMSKHDAAAPRCAGASCDAEGAAAGNAAVDAGDASTAAFVAGGACAVVATVLWLTAPDGSATAGGARKVAWGAEGGRVVVRW